MKLISLLTSADVAKHLHIAEGTLRNWRIQNKGPRFFRLPSGQIRYYIEDVIEWVEAAVREK